MSSALGFRPAATALGGAGGGLRVLRPLRAICVGIRGKSESMSTSFPSASVRLSVATATSYPKYVNGKWNSIPSIIRHTPFLREGLRWLAFVIAAFAPLRSNLTGDGGKLGLVDIAASSSRPPMAFVSSTPFFDTSNRLKLSPDATGNLIV